MREFFHGWRRKAGCVALVLACAVMGLWFRSFAIFDVISLANGQQQHQIASASGRLFWGAWRERSRHSRPRNEWERIGTSRRTRDEVDIQLESFHNFRWIIPYWSVVLPLTLLSAYLILWEPRKRTEQDHA